MAPIVSRGFRGRRAADVDPARIPPGQYVTADFPVLSAGPTPHTALELWDFSIVGELAEPRGWTWEEFRALPSEEITRDIHCVTKWTKLDTVWRGVSVDTLLEGIETTTPGSRAATRPSAQTALYTASQRALQPGGMLIATSGRPARIADTPMPPCCLPPSKASVPTSAIPHRSLCYACPRLREARTRKQCITAALCAGARGLELLCVTGSRW